MPPLIDLAGRRFGRLVVTGRAPNAYTSAGNPRTCWFAACDCGASTVVRQGQLTQGRTTSCGCRQREAGGRERLPGIPSYKAHHRRIARDLGRANEFLCCDCWGDGVDWSYNGGCADEVEAAAGMPYCPHAEHYSPRCKGCHIRHDRARDAAGRFAPRSAAREVGAS